MKNNDLAQKVKTLRNRKGYSQEELADKTGLSLRTIQRIENGETEPRGDSLKRLATVFEVSPDEIVDWTVQEDKGFLVSMNLSALTFLIVPLGGILVPLIIWISKKDKIKGVNELAKDLLNFQITWLILLFIGAFIIAATIIFGEIASSSDAAFIPVDANELGYEIGRGAREAMRIGLFSAICYVYNLTFIIVNSIRLNKEKSAVYFPAFPFLTK